MLIVGLRLVSRGKSRCFLWREMHTLWPLAPLLHFPLNRRGFVLTRALPDTKTSSHCDTTPMSRAADPRETQRDTSKQNT